MDHLGFALIDSIYPNGCNTELKRRVTPQRQESDIDICLCPPHICPAVSRTVTGGVVSHGRTIETSHAKPPVSGLLYGLSVRNTELTARERPASDVSSSYQVCQTAVTPVVSHRITHRGVSGLRRRVTRWLGYSTHEFTPWNTASVGCVLQAGWPSRCLVTTISGYKAG